MQVGQLKRESEVTAFAPASIGNVGPGFDVLGLAIAGLGDRVTAIRSEAPGVRILEISGAEGLPLDPRKNTAGIAAAAVLRAAGAGGEGGVVLRLEKGIRGNGLGGSAASAVAAAVAVNRLLGDPLSRPDLLDVALEAERAVSGGTFLDNVSASLYGGLTVTDPERRTVECVPLGDLSVHLVIVTPDVPLRTRKARAVLPKTVPRPAFVGNLARACTLVAAAVSGHAEAFGRAVHDAVIEPYRAPLIPGFAAVKRAALRAGAWGCSISGAGSSVFAVVAFPDLGETVGSAMVAAFRRAGVEAVARVTTIDREGARVEPKASNKIVG